MRLESALYSSREGLTAQGQAISVVGDNISNSNTVGFKKSRIEFADIMAGGADGGTGSPAGEVGSGVKVNKIRQIHETGVIEFTGRNLDLGIAGDGFFVVQNGDRDFYTRAGNFSVDSEGQLIDQDGNTVMGFTKASPTTLVPLNMVEIDTAGSPTTNISLTGNLNASADLDEPSLSQTINVYDTLGERHEMNVIFTKTDVAARKWKAEVYVDGGDLSGGEEDTRVLLGTFEGLTFNDSGGIDPASKENMKIDVTGVNYDNGAAAGAFTVQLGNFSQFSGTSIVNSITNDGQGSGNIKSYSIAKNGVISAVLDTGVEKELGTIALADFANLDALDRAGNSTFVESEGTGDRTLNAPGSGGSGEIQSGALERSTVDIADQFVELVIFQRAYQASSQTLNAANTLLRDTLALIR
jgi:flagellar hook protein FlgE